MNPQEQRALDLLVDRATEGLSPRRSAELEGLLASYPELNPEPFELAAAAIELAYTLPEEPMPARLARRMARRVRGMSRLRRSVCEGKSRPAQRGSLLAE